MPMHAYFGFFYFQSKRDSARRTGSQGGVEKKMDEVDLAILDVLEEDNELIDGLDLPETEAIPSSSVSEKAMPSNTIYEKTTGNATADTPPKSMSSSNLESRPSTDHQRCRKRHKSSNGDDNESEKNEEKNKLKVRLLEIEIYKKRLEVLKLERELGIDSSKFTEDLV